MDILHRIGVENATPAKVYEALATTEGLAGWWTADTTLQNGQAGRTPVGSVIQFRFPPVGGMDMEVIEAVPDKRVSWQVVDGPEEWLGTTVEWDLRLDGDYTIVLFRHAGWREPVEFMYHCSTKWGSFLMSLKSMVEMGAGAPAPGDVQISDWH